MQEIKYNPGRYHDRKVSIDGVVTSAWGVPLVPFRLYKVDDGTGEVTIVSQGGRTPTRASHVRVTGRVSDMATFGGIERRHVAHAAGHSHMRAAGSASVRLATQSSARVPSSTL